MGTSKTRKKLIPPPSTFCLTISSNICYAFPPTNPNLLSLSPTCETLNPNFLSSPCQGYNTGFARISLNSMGCGLSTPFINEDGPGTAPAPEPASSAPRIDEIKGNRRSHKRSQSQECSKGLHETDRLLEVPGRKSVSGRLESIEEAEQHRVPLDLTEAIENSKEESGENVVAPDEREEEIDGSEFGPGSPSFREYCLHPTIKSVDMDDFYHSKSYEPKKEQKHKRRHSIASSEGSNTMFVKKEHKSGRFKRVIPKRGQAAVKNLLNVTICYCTNPHPHPDHLSPTTSA